MLMELAWLEIQHAAIVMKLFLKINEDGIVEDVKFKTFGCGAAIASSSMATELIKGKRWKKLLS